MGQPDLLMVCFASFGAVFVVLAFLAATMRILIRVFPEKGARINASTLAAITAAASTAYPRTKVTNVRETK